MGISHIGFTISSCRILVHHRDNELIVIKWIVEGGYMQRKETCVYLAFIPEVHVLGQRSNSSEYNINGNQT